MKTFKDVGAFERRLQRGIAWDDYFMLDGRMWNIYEYGPGIGASGPEYIYFLNKRSGDMLHIVYDCPSFQYVNGVRVQTKQYHFHKLERIEKAYQWR